MRLQPPIAHHIEMAIEQKKTLIEETLLHISIENLQNLQTHVSANNNEQSRIDYLAKFIFAQDYDKIENMNTSMKLCDSAIRSITTLKFFENFMSTRGLISWDLYKDTLIQATQQIQAHLDISPSSKSQLAWNYSK